MSEERLKLLKKNVVAIFFDILKNMRFTGVAVAQRWPQLYYMKPKPSTKHVLAVSEWFWTLPRAQRTWGLSSTFQSLNKFKHESWSNFIFRISTKHSLQNSNQTSASRLNLKFKIFTKSSFRVSTNIQSHDLCKHQPAKYGSEWVSRWVREKVTSIANDWTRVR